MTCPEDQKAPQNFQSLFNNRPSSNHQATKWTLIIFHISNPKTKNSMAYLVEGICQNNNKLQ